MILYFEIKTSWRNNFFLFLLQFQTAMSKWSRGERGKGCIRGVAFHSPLRSVIIRGAMLTGNKWAIWLRSVPQSFVHFPVATERSGTLLTIMGTPLEHCNFSSHSLFPSSAPLRATIIGTSTWTVPSSYGAERNSFGWEHHLKIAISLAIQYLPSPLRSVPKSLVQALEHFPVPTERSGTLLTMIWTPLEHCNFSSHSLFPRSAPLRASITGTFPSSNGAERNAFDNDGNTTWTLQFL